MAEGDLSYPGIVPDARGEERTWFAFCQNDRLVVQRCRDCGIHIFYPRSVCPSCLGRGLEWVDSDGRGVVHTYTVQYRSPQGFGGEPYVIAMIELAEGVRMMSRVMAEPERVAIGMPVQVRFARITEDFQVPVFVPSQAAEHA